MVGGSASPIVHFDDHLPPSRFFKDGVDGKLILYFEWPNFVALQCIDPQPGYMVLPRADCAKRGINLSFARTRPVSPGRH